MRLFPYSVALSLFISWLALLFLAYATVNILKDLKVEIFSLQLLALRLTMGWQGWLAPYFAAAIAIIIRWPSKFGWLWGLTLCLVSDMVGLALLSLQLAMFYYPGRPSQPLIPIPILLCLSIGVLVVLQITSVSLLFSRRRFFAT